MENPFWSEFGDPAEVFPLFTTLPCRSSRNLVSKWPDSGQNWGMPGESQRDALIKELKIVRKAGLHRLRERSAELPELSVLATKTMGAGQPDDIERMVRHVYRSFGEGAQATAVGILFGLELGRRGASPSVLRQVAAERLGYFSVETFRKKPEYNAIAYFADILIQYAADAGAMETRNPNKVEHIMELISGLTVAEYNDLMRRIRHWFSTLAQVSPGRTTET